MLPEGISPPDSVPWWRGAVIYQIYPRSFLDTGGNGVGDLKGCTQKLSYIASLGVDGIWLSPFFTSPMDDFGYDVSDYCDVDPLFGTLSDFDALIKEAHNLDLKVIIDQVYSHTSDQHAWFQESKASRDNAKSDWYVWADAKPDGTPPSNWQSVFGGLAWQWDSRRRQYYLHNFLTSQPDLNLHNSDVQDALLTVARFWLDRGVNGFRLDALNFAMHDPSFQDNPPVTGPREAPTRPYDFQDHTYNMSHPDILPFLERLRAVLDTYPGDRFTVAEIARPEPVPDMKAYTAQNKRLSTAYSFDYLYANELSAKLVRDISSQWPNNDGSWPSWAFSNHDAPRVASRWAIGETSPAHAKLFLMLLIALRGNIFLYQGEELGLSQGEVPFEKLQDPEAIANWPETLGRDGARTPMPWDTTLPHAGFSDADPWLPVDPCHPSLAVTAQEQDASSTLHFVRELIHFRQNEDCLRFGDLNFLDAPEEILAFTRTLRNQTVLCAFNLSEKTLTWQLPVSASWDITLTTVQSDSSLCAGQLDGLSGFYAKAV